MNKEEFVKYIESNEFYQYEKVPERYVKDYTVDNETLLIMLRVSLYKTGNIVLSLFIMTKKDLSLLKYKDKIEKLISNTFPETFDFFDIGEDSSFQIDLKTKNINYAKNWVDVMNNEKNVRELVDIIVDYSREGNNEI